MRRYKIEPRENYTEIIESQGLTFHKDYWKEDAYYEFSSFEIGEIEKATTECYKMYVDAVQHVIDNNLWDRLHIPIECRHAIVKSWDRDDLSLYGRFDFALINGTPKLLEFNADTPTSLLESSIIQWYWKEDKFGNRKDQFNSLHESLVESFRVIHEKYQAPIYHMAYLRDSGIPGDFTFEEDTRTTKYIISCALEAGLTVADIDITQLEYYPSERIFRDPGGIEVTHCFKLYPFEWMMLAEDPEAIGNADIVWIEPLWKAVMSNKALLPILHELFPYSPYILPAYTEEDGWKLQRYCKKPIFSREGANVKLVQYGTVIEETEGEYGEEGYICQELVDLECFDGKYPIVGSWVIGGESVGMGIRESDKKITGNTSNYIPHIIY